MKRIALFLALAFSSGLQAAIAVSSAGVQGTGQASTFEFISFTTGTGSNRILVAEIATTQAGGHTTTGVTWNGLPMTLALETTVSNTLTSTASVWYLMNPTASTTATIVATFSVAVQSQIGGVEYSGVHTTPFGATATGAARGAAAITGTATVTTTFANSWVIANTSMYYKTAPTLDGTWTTRRSTQPGVTGGFGVSQDKSAASIGNYTVTNYFPVSADLREIATQLLELRELVVPAASSQNRAMELRKGMRSAL